MSPPGHVSKCKIIQIKKPAAKVIKEAVCDDAGKVKSCPIEIRDDPIVLKELFTVEFPRSLAAIGPKQIQAMSPFISSALIFGATTAILVAYMTEWKAVLKYMPYYGGKYPKPEE